MSIEQQIAGELSVRAQQVEAAVGLLDGGATVPFVARYRKEATGGLDDTQLRVLEERLSYLRDLDARRVAVCKSLQEQGKLTPELAQAIADAQTKTRLEDLYAPYKRKRTSKAERAKAAGLELLLDKLLADRLCDPTRLAEDFCDEKAGFPDTPSVLDGAQQIFVARVGDDADLVAGFRDALWNKGYMRAKVIAGKEQDGSKFSDYFQFEELIAKVPSHRALALFRGRSEGVLRLKLLAATEESEAAANAAYVARIAHSFSIDSGSRHACDVWLNECAVLAWRTLRIRLESDLLARLRVDAEREAIAVFGNNLRDVLLAPPAGARSTMGLDPGLRTGVKVAVVDDTGKLLAHETIYPHVPQKRWDEAIAVLQRLAAKHDVELVSIGNGTASRETDELVRALQQRHPELSLTRVMVSEAGASIYSASAVAAQEFPDLDVSIRGAVSIARRLQDPLAELVKIEPKSIGVGQYQHDVDQGALSGRLDLVVEDAVNAVGVAVNTASAALLSRVAGLNAALAANIVTYRESHGRFKTRTELKKVPRLGPKAFEQAAGFLRIQKGDNPLDASAVHPEAYPVVRRMVSTAGKGIDDILGNEALLATLRISDFVDAQFGEPTIRDIIAELNKPGRDPRPAFKAARFKEGVDKISDLNPGMVLEGIVSNVTNFGAFVDIGVHQDGLVHISAMATRFVKDPREIVKAGDVIEVKVMSVEPARKRIGLTMRLDDALEDSQAPTRPAGGPKRAPDNAKRVASSPEPSTAMADAFARMKRRKH